MEISQTVNLYITYVEKEGPFLKVWGQTEKNNSIYVEQFLLGASPQFDLGVGKISVDNLQGGTLVCAKYKDNKYYRARITNASFLGEGFVEVSFLDYGNKDIVPCTNIRSLQNFPSSFISVPPLATGFIFAEAHCPGGGEWNDTILENISKELKYREVQCTLVIQATQYFLVKLYVGGSDLCTLFINRGLMQPISLQAQQAVLLSMSMQRINLLPTQHAPSASTAINTYKACTLEPGCQYPVYVSYVNDGPCHFSVQLKQSEEVLVMLMNDINTITLRLLEDVPIPGTICLARCQEDGNICRAVVTNEVDNQFKVFYVDFGNYEVVPLEALYLIPFKYVIPKVMAIRFSLAGVEKSTVTLEMQCAFKQFVDNRLLYMKVLPTPTRMAIPKCELWDPETKTSALDVVNRAAQNAYPEPVSLNRGFSQLVKVSYVYSCNRFYVQLASKENELIKLMLDLQASCQTNDSMDLSLIKVGLPCCALFESDQQWYRSQIVEVISDNVKVRYIDYGNEEMVLSSQLKIIDGEQLTVLRPQAIECCLNGYQNMEEDLQRDGFLEELILEQQFTMKVVEMSNKKALVELFDESNYNVASLLLDKLASAKSQVSPMLVQAGNKIEHRKSFSNQNGPREQNFRQDCRPGRTNDRNENSWNQDKKDFRSNDRNSNENSNERNSWRQNNKGFSPTNDRFNNRDRNRNKNEWQNKENASTDGWDNDTSKPEEKDAWTKPSSNAGFQNNSRENDYSRNRENDYSHNRNDRFNKDNWNSGGQKGGGFKKRNDYRKDGSDISSSGSEKSFQKGPRTSSRTDRPQFHKKFDKPRNASFTNNIDTSDSWNVSAVSSTIDAAPTTATFVPYDPDLKDSNVIISWFHNPSHFYCQLESTQDQFKNLMTEIQTFYKSCKPESAVVGAPVIGLFPEDNVLYRAQVLEAFGGQYKVYYVDFGNVSNVTKVWPIDKKFMSFPAQAIVCSLNEIAPPGDHWPDPDNYSKYFDKDKYVCRFVNKDEEKTYVDVFYGNDNIRQLLIQEGLAVSTQTIIPDIEIPLLLGQQFRAILKSVNNLSDIIIALECGAALSCKMHNLEEAVTTDDNNLKRFLERTVIIYVDNVIDDKLEVTLYDTEGSKVEVVSPDEGACDMVELPCPILIFRSNLTGYVSHVDETSVFIQPTEYSEVIALLLDQMYESYENLAQDVTILPDLELLYAAKSGDGNWYRAKVMNISDTQASVSYIDYGNTEDVDFDKLRQLTDKFLETCILCIQVYVTVETDTLVDKDVVSSVYYGENGWEGTVEVQAPEDTAQAQTPEESSATESADADRIDTKDEVVDKMSEIPVEVAQPVAATIEYPDEVPEVGLPETAGYTEPSAEDVQNGFNVVVSHIDSPTEFYLQLSDSLSAIAELQLNLQEQAPDMPVMETPAAGILCAAPFSVDQQWYRAEVLDADDDITTVRFIDYGNTDVISNDTTKIKTLPTNLLSLAVYATRASLKVKSLDGEWSSATMKRFEALIAENNITAEFINQDEKTNYVELYSNGQNVKDVLINENLATPIDLSNESKSTCFVSHLNSPSEFWLQLENCVDELEWIAEQLSGAESFPELEDTTPGTLCAALFPDDQMWYRARILSDTVAGLELLFIDYGNSSLSSSLRQLPEDLVVTPPLAQKCSLQKPDGIPCWSPQAANKFSEISADGQTIFTVHKISTGETSVVQLLIDGQDVTSMLLPETEDGYVRNVESVDGFAIEKNGEVLPESYKLEPLPGMTWTEESTDKFKELTDQGTKLFQIEFIAEDTVRLYTDGTDIRTNLGGIKTSVLNASRSSTDEDKTENDDDIGVYLEDIVPNHVPQVPEATTKESKDFETTQDEATEVINSPSSSEDIKHILGIGVTENISEQKNTEEKVTIELLKEEPCISELTSSTFVEDTSDADASSKVLLNIENENVCENTGITLQKEMKDDSETGTPKSNPLESQVENVSSNIDCDSVDQEPSVHTKDKLDAESGSDSKALLNIQNGEGVDVTLEEQAEYCSENSTHESNLLTSEVTHRSDSSDRESSINTKDNLNVEDGSKDLLNTENNKMTDAAATSGADNSKTCIPESSPLASETDNSSDKIHTSIVNQQSPVCAKDEPDTEGDSKDLLNIENIKSVDVTLKKEMEYSSDNCIDESNLPASKVDVASNKILSGSPDMESSGYTKDELDIEDRSKHVLTTENNKSADVTVKKGMGDHFEISLRESNPLTSEVDNKSDKAPPSTLEHDPSVCANDKLDTKDGSKDLLKIENKSTDVTLTKAVRDNSETSIPESNLLVPDDDHSSDKKHSSISVQESSDCTKDNSDKESDKSDIHNSETSIQSGETKHDADQKLLESMLEGRKMHILSENTHSFDSLSESEVAIILRDVIENALSKKETAEVRSRPASSCSGKISHDDRIVPAVASRPHSPIQDEDTKLEKQVKSRPPSSCSGKFSHDERIVPAVLSRPQSPIILSDNPDDQEVKQVKSRPPSSCSGKISHDKRIVPAVLSRPQSPIISSDDKDDQGGKSEN